MAETLAVIGLAIELGLIDPITHFVLGEAVNSIDRLDDAFGGGTKIAVNVAAKQAGDVAFMRLFIENLPRPQDTTTATPRNIEEDQNSCRSGIH